MTGRPTLPPDVELDGFRTDRGVARAASVRGDGHRYGSEPRQDSAGCWWVPGDGGGWTILAVADGLGSQPLSEVGSATTLSALYELPGFAWASAASGNARAVDEIIEHVDVSIRREARLKNADPRQLSSTLTIAVVAHEQAAATVFRVGDSPCYLVRESAWSSVFSEGASGEIATTGTDCLPSDRPVIEAQTVALLQGDVLVVCSDGFSGTLRVDGRDVYLAEQWGARPPSLTELLWHVDSMVKSYDDDRSVAAWWEGFHD